MRLICDAAFLTERAFQGDVVVYVGNNVGPWLLTISKMFPTLQFLVYDGNAVKLSRSLEQERSANPGAFPNIHLRQCWFSEAEAARFHRLGLVSQRDPSINRTLLMAETINMNWDKENPDSGPVYKDPHKDLGDQDAWVQALRPRSALLRFNLPYSSSTRKQETHYNYLKGTIMLQVCVIAPWQCVLFT